MSPGRDFSKIIDEFFRKLSMASYGLAPVRICSMGTTIIPDMPQNRRVVKNLFHIN